MTGSVVLWAAIGVCMVVLAAAMVVMVVRSAHTCCEPAAWVAQTAPVVVAVAALVGVGVLQVVNAVRAAGWVDDTAAAVVVAAMAAVVVGHRGLSVVFLFNPRTGRWRGPWGDWWHGPRDGSDARRVR